MDVNIKFDDSTHFEFIPQLTVFDILSINLYHGWVIDSNDTEYFPKLGHQSYNQLTEAIIHATEATDRKSEIAQTGILAEKFLSVNASQLTYCGLIQLHQKLGEREIGVLFRNNHFSVLFKNEGELYTLVADQGYLRKNTIAWERLSEVDGSTDLLSPVFGDPNHYTVDTFSPETSPLVVQEEGEGGLDHLLAAQLQEEENEVNIAPPPPLPPKPRVWAKKPSDNDKHESKDCVIL